MKQDAEDHAEEDKKRREDIDAKHQADSLVFSTEKIIKDDKENKIKDETKGVHAHAEERVFFGGFFSHLLGRAGGLGVIAAGAID